MQSRLQNFRNVVVLLRKSTASFMATTLIVVLVLAIDVVAFANLGRTMRHHFACSNPSRSMKPHLARSAKAEVCRLYSSVLSNSAAVITQMKWPDIGRLKM